MHNVRENKQRYYRIERAGHKSKSGRPVRPYSTSSTFSFVCSTNMSKTLQELAVLHLFTECMDGLFHKITE